MNYLSQDVPLTVVIQSPEPMRFLKSYQPVIPPAWVLTVRGPLELVRHKYIEAASRFESYTAADSWAFRCGFARWSNRPFQPGDRITVGDAEFIQCKDAFPAGTHLFCVRSEINGDYSVLDAVVEFRLEATNAP